MTEKEKEICEVYKHDNGWHENKVRNEDEKEGELLHMRYECGVIKMTSDGGATNIVSSFRWTHNEDGFQGLWLCTKSREDEDEVQRESILSSLLSSSTQGEIYRPSYDSLQ